MNMPWPLRGAEESKDFSKPVVSALYSLPKVNSVTQDATNIAPASLLNYRPEKPTCGQIDIALPYPQGMKVRDIIKRIEADGWRQISQKGSHRQYKHPEKSGRATVPGHPVMTFTRALKKVFGIKRS